MSSNIEQTIAVLTAKHKAAKDRLQDATALQQTAESSLIAARTAQTIGQQIATEIQQKAHNKIATVVTRGLQTVFEEDIEFKIIFELKAGRTEARMVFLKDGFEVDPMEESGGGLVDVASFAVRIACLLLSRPPKRRLLILDEPFKFVSQGYREKLKTLITLLAKEMSIQFVIVTHIEELKFGTLIELS